MTEPDAPDDYRDYYGDDGQSARRGVVLTETELREYRAYFPDERPTAPTAIEENQ